MKGAAPSLSANGLGIYHPGIKQENLSSSEVKSLNLVNTDSSLPNVLQETDPDTATILPGPQVVSIRKGQPKQFNWRKGGVKMAKNVTKGLKGLTSGGERAPTAREIGHPYEPQIGGVPYNMAQAGGGSENNSLYPSRQGSDGMRPVSYTHLTLPTKRIV